MGSTAAIWIASKSGRELQLELVRLWLLTYTLGKVNISSIGMRHIQC